MEAVTSSLPGTLSQSEVEDFQSEAPTCVCVCASHADIGTSAKVVLDVVLTTCPFFLSFFFSKKIWTLVNIFCITKRFVQFYLEGKFCYIFYKKKKKDKNDPLKWGS